jgi:hypothetical protein
VMAIIVGYKAQSTPLHMKHWTEYLAHTIHHILNFLQLWFIPFKLFIKL